MALSLVADCGRCAALCCLATHLERGPDFAFTKPAGALCPLLDERTFACRAHDALVERGLSGCHVYTCHGAGNAVTDRLATRARPAGEVRALAMESFLVVRGAFETLAGLTLARAHVDAALAARIDDARASSMEAIARALDDTAREGTRDPLDRAMPDVRRALAHVVDLVRARGKRALTVVDG